MKAEHVISQIRAGPVDKGRGNDKCCSNFKKEGTHMRTGTRYFKTFSKMMWMFALLLVVFSAGCDRDLGISKGIL